MSKSFSITIPSPSTLGGPTAILKHFLQIMIAITVPFVAVSSLMPSVVDWLTSNAVNLNLDPAIVTGVSLAAAAVAVVARIAVILEGVYNQMPAAKSTIDPLAVTDVSSDTGGDPLAI